MCNRKHLFFGLLLPSKCIPQTYQSSVHTELSPSHQQLFIFFSFLPRARDQENDKISLNHCLYFCLKGAGILGQFYILPTPPRASLSCDYESYITATVLAWPIVRTLRLFTFLATRQLHVASYRVTGELFGCFFSINILNCMVGISSGVIWMMYVWSICQFVYCRWIHTLACSR